MEYYKDLAFPTASLVFCLLGVPVGIASKRSGRIGGFAVGVLVVIIYYMLNIACEFLVTTATLPPGFGPSSAPPAVPAPPTMAASPLTGLPMDIVGSKRPVLVVKIDNAPKARPQIGLNQADVVFEEGVEGGITRFAALFHSEMSKPVGPVRSARSTDIKIVSAFHHPLFAYSGANALFQQYVAEAPLVDVGVDKYPDRYHRDNGRSSPYNLFSDTETLLDLAPDGSVPPPVLFAFRSPGAAPSGPGAHAVTHARVWWQASKMTEAIWDWDPTAKGWRRTQNGETHVDAAGRQVTPANVVVQFVSYHDTGLVDSSGTSVPEADVVGEGDAWVLTGHAHPVPLVEALEHRTHPLHRRHRRRGEAGPGQDVGGAGAAQPGRGQLTYRPVASPTTGVLLPGYSGKRTPERGRDPALRNWRSFAGM